jgi:hypothetical protein
MKRIFSSLVLGSLLLPSIAFGLAGFSEQDTEYYYSPKILIDFNTPSDFCPPEHGNQYCILLYGTTDAYGPKQFDIARLTAVNVPQTTEPQYVIGKSYEDGDWLVFDLKNDKQILKDTSYSRVESQWEKLGNVKPVFADTENYSKYFHDETEKSKQASAEMEKGVGEMLLYGWLVLLVVVSVLCGLVFGIIYLIEKFTAKKS